MTDLLITLKQMALVPREATDEMADNARSAVVIAVNECRISKRNAISSYGKKARLRWKAMLAAAPVQVVSEAMLREALDRNSHGFYRNGFRAAFQLLHDAGLIKLTEDAE